jgi:uncharacterized membrane protein
MPSRQHLRAFQGIALALLVIGIVLFAWSIPQHDFYVDEAFIGEYAYFHARDGYVHSEFWRGFLRQDEYVTLYHRLAVWSGSALITLFGAELWALRLGSIGSGLVTALLLAWWARRFVRGSWADAWTGTVVALAAWLLMPTVFYHAKCFRPEVQTAMFGLASFCTLSTPLLGRMPQNNGRLIMLSALSGGLAGTAMLTHLAGVMYAGAGVLLLLTSRHYWLAGIFIVVCTLAFSPCMIDIVRYWELFQIQIANPQAQSKLAWTPLTPLWNLLAEQQRFFRKPQFILMSCTWIVALLLTWRTASREERFLRTYTFLLILILGAMLEDKRDYMSLYAPFMALTIASGIHAGLEQWSGLQLWKRVAVSLVIWIFVGYGLVFQVQDATWAKEDVASMNAAIGRYIPKGAWCLAPMNMMFNQIGRVHLVSYSAVADVWNGDRATTSIEAASRACERLGIEYVVMNCFAEERECIVDAAKRASILDSAFTTVAHTNEYWILRHRHAHGF